MPRHSRPPVRAKHSRAHVREQRIRKQRTRFARLRRENLIDPLAHSWREPPKPYRSIDDLCLELPSYGRYYMRAPKYGQLAERLNYRHGLKGCGCVRCDPGAYANRTRDSRTWRREAEAELLDRLQPGFQDRDSGADIDRLCPDAGRPQESDLWGMGEGVSYTGRVWPARPGARERAQQATAAAARLLAEIDALGEAEEFAGAVIDDLEYLRALGA